MRVGLPRSRHVWRRIALKARQRRGRVLGVKLGFNPNSSSLGVDITFFLLGVTAVSMLTPSLGALVRWHHQRRHGR